MLMTNTCTCHPISSTLPTNNIPSLFLSYSPVPDHRPAPHTAHLYISPRRPVPNGPLPPTNSPLLLFPPRPPQPPQPPLCLKRRLPAPHPPQHFQARRLTPRGRRCRADQDAPRRGAPSPQTEEASCILGVKTVRSEKRKVKSESKARSVKRES